VSAAAPVNVPETPLAAFGAAVVATGVGVALCAVALADVVDAAEFVVEVAAFFFAFFLVVVVVVVVAGAGVVAGVAAGAVVAAALLEEPESEVPESEVPESEPPLKPPELPNCGGVIDTTAPSPPMVPPTISAKRLDSMEFKLLRVYFIFWNTSIFS